MTPEEKVLLLTMARLLRRHLRATATGTIDQVLYVDIGYLDKVLASFDSELGEMRDRELGCKSEKVTG